ncbi:N-lysine methyltransferase SMYD2-A-like [Branchiostoma floridae]|uniref:[histone H3]-lysine(4) N-trimethyltransferase n=2 Tax=Branchiostoma floridae TaxID=7739 RepID=A0A9J7LE35_BRAFL|nr:N-lysine methyltransferase SMYD2-A-like [Branchiostoma floridae]
MVRYHVEIFLEPGKGRGLRASRSGKGLEPGTLIITERPYCYALLNGEEENHCHYCLAEERKDEKLLLCPGCTTARYCNEQCKKSAELDHKSECRGYRQLMLMPYHLRLIGRIIYRQHVRKLETGPLDPLNDLCSHMEDLAGSFGMDSQLGYLARVVDKDVIPNWAYFQRLFGKVTCNCFAISNSELKDIAVGVYPQAAMLNHSCRSNTIATFQGPNMEIRTFSHVPPGEEVFHAYVQKGVTTDRRRDDLLEKYFFFCQCLDCLDLERDLRMRTVKCPNCGGPVLPNSESKSVYEKCSRCEHDDFDEEFHEKVDTAVEYADNVITKERRWCNGLEYEMQFRQNCLLEIDKVLHEDNVHTIRILVGLFHAAAGLGEWRQAIEWGQRLERGLNLYLQANEPDVGNLHHKLGKAYFHLGDQEKGRFHALKAKEIYTITHGRRKPQVKMVKDLLKDFDEVVSDDEEEEGKEEEDDDKRSRKLPSDWNPADYKCWIDPRENKRNAEKKEADPPRKIDFSYREEAQVKREGKEFRSKLSSLLDNGATRKETSSTHINGFNTVRPSRVMCLRQDESNRRSSSLDRYTANSRPASPRYTTYSRPESPRYTTSSRPASPASLALERARNLLNKIEVKTSTSGSLALSRPSYGAGRYDDRRYASLRIPSASRRFQPAYMAITLSR